MSFQHAGVADILRKTQKDEQFIDRYNNSLVEFLRLTTNNNESKIKRYSAYISEFFYYVLTSLSNLQTLGEEYTSIIRFNRSKNNIPSKVIQFLWLILYVCGKEGFYKTLQKLEKKISEDQNLTSNAKDKLLEFCKTVRSNEDIITRLHLSLFYIQKKYYNISNRLMRIEYVAYAKNEEFNTPFNVLGVVSLTYLLGNIFYNVFTSKNLGFSKSNVSKTEGRTERECFLCADEKINATLLSCGHYFCWNCVFDLIATKARCPICRDPIDRNAVVMLENL